MRILTHFAHGAYQTALAALKDIMFYHIIDEEAQYFSKDACPKKSWDDSIPLPSNIIVISAKEAFQIKFDLILAHWHPFIVPFHTLWPELPMIFLEHTYPYKNLKSEVFRWRNIRHDNCAHTVFITPSSQKAWGAEKDAQASYIYHSIDVDNFPQKIDYSGQQIMTTTNEFISRDWACGFSLWARVLGVPMSSFFTDIALYGYGNANIGKTAKGMRTRQEILDLLCKAGVYFNPSIMSPIPMSLLEAAAVGTPIVSTKYCEPGELFKSGEHGIISNDIGTLRRGIKQLLANPDEAKCMALNAKKVVKELFKPKKFCEEWSNIFNKIK